MNSIKLLIVFLIVSSCVTLCPSSTATDHCFSIKQCLVQIQQNNDIIWRTLKENYIPSSTHNISNSDAIVLRNVFQMFIEQRDVQKIHDFMQYTPWFHCVMQSAPDITLRLFECLHETLSTIQADAHLFALILSELMDYIQQYNMYPIPGIYLEIVNKFGDQHIMSDTLQQILDEYLFPSSSNTTGDQLWNDPNIQQMTQKLQNARNATTLLSNIKRVKALHDPWSIRSIDDYPTLFKDLGKLIRRNKYLQYYNNNDNRSIAKWEILMKKQFMISLQNQTVNNALNKSHYYTLWQHTIERNQLLMTLDSYPSLAQVFMDKYNDCTRFAQVYSWFINELNKRDWREPYVYASFLKMANVVTQAVVEHNLTNTFGIRCVGNIWNVIKLYDASVLAQNVSVTFSEFGKLMRKRIFSCILKLFMDTHHMDDIRDIATSEYFPFMFNKSLIHRLLKYLMTMQFDSEKGMYFMEIMQQLCTHDDAEFIVVMIQSVNCKLREMTLYQTNTSYLNDACVKRMVLSLSNSVWMQSLQLGDARHTDEILPEIKHLMYHLEILHFNESSAECYKFIKNIELVLLKIKEDEFESEIGYF